ncbi:MULTISPECIES: lysylphosphatidylglycerol synthase transmembrane domain-containing protein [unclassified Streptomyces]|uniref:lysylphosphatidylglycerol synthase transmembrane domain-containing protein n=1 Tax=unclassified Streptomyces TaxID=2593676 RepID=UPI00225BFCB5|nr:MULTISPECIES: lysylphosphatidylglycerol synthase domain-containing protein [unclassified Streptomyces]MCX5051772.1 lysylphosphatidylglycerol synthase domain-containing protein [Streptomyces sp. NBC_00474]MCX5249666.1 lysylphosphatidylglycerol synthase domain-containing protein [Streptomyces sp. NBC_00201]
MSLLPLENVPGPLPATVPCAASPLPAPAPSPLRLASPARLLRRSLVILPVLLIGIWAVVDWRTVYDGTARLASADPWWLLVAFFFTCLGWLSSACVRQGALPERLPTGLLIASQFAAGAANHVLPASIGAHAVTLRFLRGQGIPLARATASLALYSVARPIAKTLVLLVFLVAYPDLLLTGELVPDKHTLLLIAAGATLGLTIGVLLVATVRPLRRPLLDGLRCALTDVRVLHTRPARMLALWGGAAAAPLLQASVIFAVGSALGLSLTWAQVALAFLAASTAVGAVPAPGGIGPVDAAVVFAMVALGAPVDISATAVIGYRVLTVWLPLLPGALVLSALVQRKVL